MSKKNKDIEVKIEEEKVTIKGQNITVNKLVIGKKEIGRIIPNEGGKFSVEMDGSQQAVTKTLDEGIEYIIRQWNLNE